MKKLYVNGCSFTYGNVLPENETWPVLLAEELNLELHNNSKNGQSMHSICYNTFMHLASFDPKETLVVIGLTWPTRHMVQAHNVTLNITPNNPTHLKFHDKISNSGHPEKYFTEDYNEEEVVEYLKKNNNIGNTVLSLVTLQQELIKIQTPERSQKNEAHLYLYNIILLQSYLESRGFKYRFINFQGPSEIEGPADANILNLLHNHNLIDMFERLQSGLIDKNTSHPSAEGAIEIKNQLVRSL